MASIIVHMTTYRVLLTYRKVALLVRDTKESEVQIADIYLRRVNCFAIRARTWSSVN